MNRDEIEKSKHELFGRQWRCPECQCDNDEQQFFCHACLFSIFFNFFGGDIRKTGTLNRKRQGGEK